MNILVSNDDGVHAPGLLALADALREIAQVVVVAPETERSGYSSALTLDRPLRAQSIAPHVWSVNGTPADCVYLALNGLLEQMDQPFDLVVSGINSGANLGDDVLYSGTVGAALEGRLLKLPALAVSLAGPQVRQHQTADAYRKAACWVREFVAAGIPQLPLRHILNINIPDVDRYRGVQVTYLGQRHPAKPLTSQVDPRGRQVYWIGLSGEAVHEQPALGENLSDFAAIAHNCVSITPIMMDSTNYALLSDLAQQVGSIHQL